jgi:hypothetical protein
MELDACAREQFFARQHVFAPSVPAHRNDVRMLDNQQLVRDLTTFAAVDKLALKRERLGVASAPEIANFTQPHG